MLIFFVELLVKGGSIQQGFQFIRTCVRCLQILDLTSLYMLHTSIDQSTRNLLRTTTKWNECPCCGARASSSVAQRRILAGWAQLDHLCAKVKTSVILDAITSYLSTESSDATFDDIKGIINTIPWQLTMQAVVCQGRQRSPLSFDVVERGIR